MKLINKYDIYVKFIYLSLNAPSVDFTLPDNTQLFEIVVIIHKIKRPDNINN